MTVLVFGPYPGNEVATLCQHKLVTRDTVLDFILEICRKLVEELGLTKIEVDVKAAKDHVANYFDAKVKEEGVPGAEKENIASSLPQKGSERWAWVTQSSEDLSAVSKPIQQKANV